MKRIFWKIYDAGAGEGAGGNGGEEFTPELMLKQLNKIKTDLEVKAKDNAEKAVEEKLKAVNDAIDELKTAKEEDKTAEKLKELSEKLEVTIKAFDILQTRVKGGAPIPGNETKSFNDHLSETIKENVDKIKSFSRTGGDMRMQMKAVGDMSIAANFASGTATAITQEVRPGLIVNPYERTWLADILPQGTSGSPSILYPKENGGEGGADVWTDKATDKPQMDFDFTGQSAQMKWIAGIVIIEREMLDDIDWLESYLRNKMLISLKVAENKFILNGTTDANPVTGLLAAATAYNGTLTGNVDKIIDAGWGQIVESTYDFYNPTHTLLRPRDAVKIGLNKASGSGEYDLPAGSVAFVNGKLTIGGINTVTATTLAAGEFLTFDRNAVTFVKRMQPEIQMFVDAALAKKNKVMFRIEERATLAIFNNNAIVKGTLA